MHRHATATLTDEALIALLDEQLHPQDRVALELLLSKDIEAQKTLEQWKRQHAALRGLYLPILDQAMPAQLNAAAQQVVASQTASNQRWRMLGTAGCVVMAFGLGWTFRGHWLMEQPPALMAKAATLQDFARQASTAYAVYSPEIRHPVEVAATEQEHLVQWLSKRVGKPVKVPNLSREGYALLGGRLLPADMGVRAQFMFQNAAGNRITLYLGGMDAEQGVPHTRDTAFNFSNQGSISSFYWIDQGFGYALSGQVPRETLMRLAQLVYDQL